jgi:Protein of unknown function (DUF3829)
LSNNRLLESFQCSGVLFSEPINIFIRLKISKFGKPIMKYSLLLVFSVVMACLVGCDKIQQAANSSNQQANTDDTANVALSNYIKAHNKFAPDKAIDPEGMNDGSLEGAMAQYQHNAEKYSAEEIPQVNIVVSNYFELGLDALDQGVKAMQGRSQRPVDKAAADLLIKAKVLQVKATEIKAYYDSKKFLEDNFAKVKAENPAFLALWKETVALNATLSSEVSRANDVRDGELAKELKEKGDFLGYNSIMAMTEAKNLVRIINSGDFDEALIKSADSKVAEIETILSAYKAEEKKAEKEGKLSNNFHAKVQQELNGMIGEYRSAKITVEAAGRNEALESAVKHYNEAVFYSNML